MLNAIPCRSILPEIITPYTVTVLPPLFSLHTDDFLNGLKAFMNSFVAPDNLGMISFEDLCAWMGSATNMVSLHAYHDSNLRVLIGSNEGYCCTVVFPFTDTG